MNNQRKKMTIVTREEINKRKDVLDAVASKTLHQFGSNFTQIPGGHIQTDIATASSIGGLIIFQENVDNLEKIIIEGGTGNALLYEVQEAWESLYRIMRTIALNYGIDPIKGWEGSIPEEHYPIYSCEEMTRKLAQDFYRICIEENLEKPFWKIAAVLVAVKLILAGRDLGILDEKVGKAIAGYYLLAGSKTIPFKDALWSSF